MNVSISRLTSFTVSVAPAMVGIRAAIKKGPKVFVSAELFDAMRKATPDELQSLMRSVVMVEVPAGKHLQLREPTE